jgi:hypothetical protein
MASPPSLVRHGDATVGTAGGLPRRSQSPKRRRPTPSPIHRRGHRDLNAAPTCKMRKVSRKFPLLTKTNYSDSSTMMRVMLRARGLWATVKDGAADEVEDQMAMEALLHGMPLEMASLTSKPSTKDACDQLELSWLGSDHARSSAQSIQRQYENISFLDSESLDSESLYDFALHFAKMVHEMEILRSHRRSLPSTCASFPKGSLLSPCQLSHCLASPQCQLKKSSTA